MDKEPGRVDAHRPVPALPFSPLTLLLAALGLMLACAHDGASSAPHGELRSLWRDYRALPAERALAIAGEPQRSRWVAGAAGGHASASDAQAQALAECRRRRAENRMQARCVLYAVGDEIVWNPPGAGS